MCYLRFEEYFPVLDFSISPSYAIAMIKQTISKVRREGWFDSWVIVERRQGKNLNTATKVQILKKTLFTGFFYVISHTACLGDSIAYSRLGTSTSNSNE